MTGVMSPRSRVSLNAESKLSPEAPRSRALRLRAHDVPMRATKEMDWFVPLPWSGLA